MAKLILRRCYQVGMEQWDNEFKTVEIKPDSIDGLIRAGWCVIGAEPAPEELEEAQKQQPTAQGVPAKEQASSR